MQLDDFVIFYFCTSQWSAWICGWISVSWWIEMVGNKWWFELNEIKKIELSQLFSYCIHFPRPYHKSCYECSLPSFLHCLEINLCSLPISSFCLPQFSLQPIHNQFNNWCLSVKIFPRLLHSDSSHSIHSLKAGGFIAYQYFIPLPQLVFLFQWPFPGIWFESTLKINPVWICDYFNFLFLQELPSLPPSTFSNLTLTYSSNPIQSSKLLMVTLDIVCYVELVWTERV